MSGRRGPGLIEELHTLVDTRAPMQQQDNQLYLQQRRRAQGDPPKPTSQLTVKLSLNALPNDPDKQLTAHN
jgi:hypothetical protein